MKLLRATLTGYKGIYNGMGLYTIDIDLHNSINKIIMIKGDNGSGKSTLFNALHMFPDSNNNLIDNMECKKELEYSYGEFKYFIDITHPISKSNKRLPTKVYIKKVNSFGNKIELNPNGNVTSYIKVLEEEFLLDQNYLSLSQLGVENRGLVDMIPSERKKFIGSIMSDIEVYNSIYKIVSEKASVFKSNINALTSKIKRVDGGISLVEKLKDVDYNLEKLEADKTDTISTIESMKNKISILDKDNSILERIDSLYYNLNEIKSRKNDSDKIINSLKNTIKINVDPVDRVILEVENDISKLTEDINNLSLETHRKLLTYESIASRINDKMGRITSLKSEENYEEYISELNKIRNQIAELSPVINDLNINDIRSISSSEYISAITYIDKIKETRLGFGVDNSLLDRVVKGLMSGKYSDNPSYYNDKINEAERELKEIRNEITSLYDELNKSSKLSNRPKNCNIDNCYFLKEIIDVRSSSELNNIIHSLETAESLYESKINEYKDILDIVITFNNYKSIIQMSKPFLLKLGIKSDLFELDKIYESVLYHYDFEEYDELDKKMELSGVIDVYNDLLTKEDKYIIYENNYNKMIKNIEELNSEIDSLNINAETLNNKIKENKQLQSEKEKSLETHKELLNYLKTLKGELDNNRNIENELNLINNEYKELLSSNEELSMLNKDILKMKAKLDQLENIRDRLLNQKIELSHNISTIKEYKKDLKELNELADKVNIIKKASSMSSGIQTVYMSMYMNKIVDVANNLLSYLFNGEFKLGSFIINEKEFKIPCQGNGIMNEDISTMSTSQKCMISLVLSFALLCQSSIKYNILKLDEMDGGLDNTNRSIFVDTLYRLIDLLKSEQVFIISHNNEMNLNECDLIVLRSSDTFHAGNIIYNYNER